MCAILLKVGERRIEDQKGRDDRSLVIHMQHKLKHNGGFKQPWNRRPELRHCIAERMSRRIRHCIGTVFFKTSMRLITREPCQGDVLTWLSRLAC